MPPLASDLPSAPINVPGADLRVDGFHYRKLQPQDVPGVCQLFDTVFHQPTTPAYWAWKYCQAPGAQPLNLVVEHMATGQLMGHMGVVIVPGRRQGQALRMGQVCDVMLHPEARSGIGPNSMYQRMNDTLRALAHAPAPAAQAPLFMYGFAGVRPATLGVRIGVYRRLQVCQETLCESRTGRPLTWSAWWARHKPWRWQAVPQAATSQAWSDAVLDRIWQAHDQALTAQPALDAAPRIVKNGAYLRWRYLHHPLQQPTAGQPPRYTLWLLRRSGFPPVGWLMTRLDPQPVVVDSCLPPGADWVQTALQALPPPEAGLGAGWRSWLAHPNIPATPTPFHACEVMGQPFRPEWPSPQFQPGDTDVF